MVPTKTAAIVYGAVEGHRHTKLFRRALASAGYELTNDTTSADVVIAHSGGCMLVPLDRPGQITLFINPTYWPGKVPGLQAARKIGADFRHYFHRGGMHYFIEHLWNWWYFFTDWGHSRELLCAAKKFDLPNSIPVPAGRVILVRNDADPWCNANLEALEQANPNIQIVRLPGEHDDCWLNPEPYVALLKV